MLKKGSKLKILQKLAKAKVEVLNNKIHMRDLDKVVRIAEGELDPFLADRLGSGPTLSDNIAEDKPQDQVEPEEMPEEVEEDSEGIEEMEEQEVDPAPVQASSDGNAKLFDKHWDIVTAIEIMDEDSLWEGLTSKTRDELKEFLKKDLKEVLNPKEDAISNESKAELWGLLGDPSDESDDEE